MKSDWQDYQEEAAEFFRSLGMSAETNVSLQGVRTSHDIDVVVKSTLAGFDVLWLIECKQWRTKVSKLHVLALREIVTDIGADRGILLSEEGFQSGAVEAAKFTSVQVTSLANLESSTRADVAKVRFAELHDRAESCKKRYWALSKQRRIECGLRPDVGAVGYSGDHVVGYIEEVLLSAFRGIFPLELESLRAIAFELPRSFTSPMHLVEILDVQLTELEARLASCETSN